jgi:hypothetical protein
MKTKNTELKKSLQVANEAHDHHLKDIETCCGDCKGNGMCSRIKIDFNEIENHLK